jgi:hypothetical protein
MCSETRKAANGLIQESEVALKGGNFLDFLSNCYLPQAVSTS